ncbi:PilZ domain-containing protein [bacterium]|nr:PilZ domain-containing protein [bacterium]
MNPENPTERRRHLRVLPTDRLPAIITRIAGWHEPDSVNVVDMSEGGIALSFADSPDDLYARESIALSIDLGGAGEITVTAYPRYIYRPPSGRFELGLEWNALDARSNNALLAYIAAVNRQSRRQDT